MGRLMRVKENPSSPLRMKFHGAYNVERIVPDRKTVKLEFPCCKSSLKHSGVNSAADFGTGFRRRHPTSPPPTHKAMVDKKVTKEPAMADKQDEGCVLRMIAFKM
jgi:hypothetical protein